MYQPRSGVLYAGMEDNSLDNRNDHRYSSTMNGTLVKVTHFPVGALHADDDSECTAPDTCGRMVYWRGGIPAADPYTD